MSVSVQTIYDQCCFVMMEDLGFSLGMFTEQQFLDILGVVILDFTQRAALYKNLFTTQIKAGVPQYTVPDDVMKPELCFVAGRIIEKVTEADLMMGHFEWSKKLGQPRQWHEDNLAPKKLELFPTPDFNGANYTGSTQLIGEYDGFFPADNNLTIVGPAAPDITAWTLLDGSGSPVLLQCVPDSFSHYIAYGILEQIFSAEGETRDVQRAAYCRARFQEAINLADAIAREELLEDDA